MVSNNSMMRTAWAWGVVVGLWAIVGVGCGSQEYESRMTASAEYFDYLGKAQSVLVGSDQPDVSSFGVKIRVPTRFRWYPPKMQSDGDGNEFPVPFGNYQRYKDRAAGINVEPNAFYDDLVNELADAVGVAAPSESEWQYEKVEKIGGYYIASGGSSASLDNHYTLIKLESRGTEYRLYLHPGPRAAGGDDASADAPAPDEELQFALLFVVPRNATQPAQLESGIKYCLEWFEADRSVPSFDADGEEGGPGTGF